MLALVLVMDRSAQLPLLPESRLVALMARLSQQHCARAPNSDSIARARCRAGATRFTHAGASGQAVSRWLLDTNVISELRRARPNARVQAFVATQPLESLFISTVTLAEIRFGIELLTDPVKRAELNEWLAHKVRPLFEHRTLEITEEVMLKWRLLVEDGRKAGHTFSQPDRIIAATALQHGLTLVTRDLSDYARTHVPLLNPWLAPVIAPT